MFKVFLFSVFNTVLPGVDVFSDLCTGVELILRGHILWGIATLSLMWMPFMFHFFVFINNYIMAKLKKCQFESRKEFIRLLLHIPFVLPIKNVYNTYLLYKMGFAMDRFNSVHSKKVESIQNEAGSAGMYESFMEAGPQAVTQLVIIFSTGYIR